SARLVSGSCPAASSREKRAGTLSGPSLRGIVACSMASWSVAMIPSDPQSRQVPVNEVGGFALSLGNRLHRFCASELGAGAPGDQLGKPLYPLRGEVVE